MADNKDDIRAVRFEDFERETRRRGGGGDGRPPGLWEQFERALDDLTLPVRRAARETINNQRFSLDGQIKTQGGRGDLLTLKQQLDHDFSAVVNGGIKGACVAVRALGTFGFVPKNNTPA